MKILMSFAAFVSAASLAGCASSFNCATVPCNNGSGKTVQECANVNGSVTYNFGGMSCNCSTAGCTSCAQEISSFCGGGGAGGSGGTGGSGGSNNCMVTLSGAASGTFPCQVAIIYSASNNLGSITVSVNMPSGYQQISLTGQRPGMPMSGTWTSNDAGAKGTMVVEQSGSAVPPAWICSIGNGMDAGSYNIPVTILSCTTVGNGSADAYCKGTGTLNASLPAVMGTNASGTVSVTATF